MTAREGSGPVPYEPDPETAIRVGWAVTLLGILIFVVSALGEYMGWWDLVGEIGMLVGTVLSIVVGFGTWFSGAGRRQLQAVGAEVRGVRGVVEANGTVLGSVDAKLDDLQRLDKLDKLDQLDVIEAALVEGDGEAGKLDAVQVELDRQTGVLDRQLRVLGEIRDGL